MTDKPEAIEVARRWISKAEHDRTNAKHTLKLGSDCPFDTVCFHAQQYAEKYLKAILVMHLVHFPRIHDMVELARLLPEGSETGATGDELRLLSLYGVEGRYPETGEEPSRPEAEKALSIADKIRSAARRQLPSEVTGASD